MAADAAMPDAIGMALMASDAAGAAIGALVFAAAGALCAAGVVAAVIGSKGTMSRATMLMILISGLTAGPAVSL